MVSRRVAFAISLAALPVFAAAASLDAVMGERLFERNWVSAPSSTKSDDGLGPLYDAPSCAACHIRGSSAVADETGVPPGMVIRLGNAKGTGDPVYGYQLQTRGVAGQTPEGNPDIAWSVKEGRRTATVTLHNLGYGPLAADTKVAMRRAPMLNGADLLVQIPESEILKQAERERARGDGIAGKPAYVDTGGKRVLGRLNWKATEPDLAAQTALAFSRDIGLSTAAHPEAWGDCTERQTACRAGPHGAEPGEAEVAEPLVDAITKYLTALMPAAPASHPQGEAVFARTGCNACHATMASASGKPVAAYTDLLLHDMGPELSDGIREGAAGPQEWRTAPLWNVAQSLKIGGLLHDGRARTVAEAIEWHGGEAASVRARYRALSAPDKAALAAFVGGL
jgi:CxxC motif-containing protein (DUF1111 family)